MRAYFQVTKFVNGLFESRADLSTFKNHIRDFLVQSKEFSAQVRTTIHKLLFEQLGKRNIVRAIFDSYAIVFLFLN